MSENILSKNQRKIPRRTSAQTSDYWEDSWILVAIGCSLFLLSSLVSHHPSDPSFFTAHSEIKSTSNIMGQFGAYISAALFFTLGFSSYLSPLFVFFYCRKIGLKKFWKIFSLSFHLYALTLVCFLSCFLQIIYPDFMLRASRVFTGGFVGISLKAYLLRYFDFWGSLIICSTFIFFSIQLIAKKSLFRPLVLKLSKIGRVLLVEMASVLLKPFSFFINKLSFAKYRSFFNFQRKTSFDLPRVAKAQKDKIKILQKEEDVILTKVISLFKKQDSCINRLSEEHEVFASSLEAALKEYHITSSLQSIDPGPVVTSYSLRPKKGLKQASILGLAKDLSLVLRVPSMHIQAHPEKGVLQFQVPNKQKTPLLLGNLLSDSVFLQHKRALAAILATDPLGSNFCEDLASMPHLLIAGSTGSGKSIGLHSFICSFLVRSFVFPIKLVLIDPKMLEFSQYEGLPQLFWPVVTEASVAKSALETLVETMENRYQTLKEAGVRSIDEYHQKYPLFEDKEKMPYLVVVIDELADLSFTIGKDLETQLTRLAQKSRACGIHLIVATQRPSVDVITGLIKANFPARLSFRLASQHDSRTILGQLGAETLLGAGDFLISEPNSPSLRRAHGAYVSQAEIASLSAFIHNTWPEHTRNRQFKR